jgi:hypothetical protein
VHRPARFSATFVAITGVDGIKSFRALLKAALRTYGLRAIDCVECAPDAREDERALAQTRRHPMSAFSDKIRNRKTGFFRVNDIDGELTLTIKHLDEDLEVFGERKDILNFEEVGQQLALNQTTAEWLIGNLGDDPAMWPGKRVTLYLAEYEYKGEVKQGIRIKRPGASTSERKPPFGNAPAGNGSKTGFDDAIPF